MAAEEIARRGAERATAVLHAVANPAAALTAAERSVLAHAAEQIRRLHREGKRVDLAPLPRRTVAAHTGLSERTARTTIDQLEHRGLLTLAVQGRRGAPGARDEHGRPKARAGLYRLPDESTLTRLLSVPASGSVGHPDQISGTPRLSAVGTPDQISGTPGTSSSSSPEEAFRMVTVSITATDVEQVVELLTRLAPDAAVQVDVAHREQPEILPANVSRLRPVRAS